MEASQEAEWPDEFTREEMLEQQSRLLIEECHLLQREVSRYQKNVAKLIDLNAEVTIERDRLRSELRQSQKHLSDCYVENSLLGNRVAGLERCRKQLEEMHKVDRSHGSAASHQHQD